MIKHFCDRCGDEMDRSVVVTIGAERPVLDRNRPTGKTLDICSPCGQDVRAVFDQKVTSQIGRVSAAVVPAVDPVVVPAVVAPPPPTTTTTTTIPRGRREPR